MNAYTVEDYRAAAKRAMAAGDQTTAKSLIARGMALQANPEGTGVGRGFVRGALQTAAAPAAMAATADITAMTDKARLASPEGESGIAYEELIRAGVPQGAFASRAANTGSPQQNVAMMQQYGVSPAAQVNYGQVVDKRIENAQNVNVADAERRVAANLSFAGKMHDKAAALPKSPVAAEYEQALADAPDSFKGWLGTITNDPVGFMSWAGETLAESGTAIGAGAATTLVTGNPVLGSSVMAMGGLSREYSNEVSRFLQEKGIDLSDEDALKALLNNPKAMQEANQRGVTRGLVIALFEMAGQGAVASNIFGKTILRRTGSQMVTEGGGEAAATYAVGDEVSIKDTLAEASVGAGSAVPESIVAGKNKLFTSKGTLADPTTLEESYRGAAGDVARQLKEIATVNNYNLKDIGTGSNGARQALEDIRSSNVSRINDLRSTLKDKLNIKNAESLDELLSVYSEAKAGIAAGKKKVSQKVTTQQLDAIKQLVGPYKEGAQLLNELQKSNVITDLFKDGVKGGISQFTDLLNPFSQSGAVYDPSRMANVATGLILPAATGGSSIKVQAGGFALGRMIDAATGRRSRVARFVNKNLNSFGLPDPEGPSLVEQKALNEAQSKERRLAIAEVATALNAPKPGPLESMTLGTGLDRAGLETVVNKMAQDFANSPEFTPVLEDISKNLAGEGNRIDALTEIIPVIGAYAQQNTPELLVAPPDNQGLLRDFNMIAPERLTGIQTAAPQQPTQDPQQSGRQFTSPENYQAGIDANIELAETLQSTLSADPDVSVTDKGQLLSVLEGLKQPLTNPTVQLQTDIEALQRNDVSSEAIDKYVRPYLDRVTNQREQRSRLQRLQDAPKKPTSTQTEAPAPTEAMTEAPVVPQTAGEMVAEGSIIEGAVRAISEGTMAPESVDAMLSSLEASTPGIRAKIEAIVNRQPPEGPAAPALRQQDDRDLEVDLSSPARPALQDVVPVGTNTNVPMETAITRASNTSKGTVYRKGRDLKVDLQKQSLKAQKLNKINLQEMTPENVGRLGDFALFDALEALKTNQNAIGWYEATIDKMVDNLGQLYPEIKTNQANRLQFFWALAATSNGLKVDKNLDLAVQVYEHLQRTGRFPTDAGIGEQANGINSGLAAYHTMLDKFNGDHKKLEEFALKKQTVRDIQNQYGVKISGEGVDTVVRGAAVIGPKIGNGFFSNLYGEYDALTMDRWLMRSVGRWRGNLIKRNKPMERKKRDELWDFLRALDDDQLGRLKTLYKGTKTKISNKAMTDAALDKLANTTAKLSMKPKWRALINEEFKNVRLIGNGLAGYLDGQIEAPSGPVERAFIREVFEKALVDLNNNPEVRKVSNKPLTMADFQALLWYQEKLLYDTAKKPIGEESKGYKDDEAPDYANAAQKLVDNRRGNTGRNRLGLARSTSGRGRGTSAANDGQRGQPLSKGALSRDDEDAPILTGATERAGSSDSIRDDGQGQKERPETLGALALQGATGNPQVVTSLEGLSDPETAADFYSRPGWAIITATNENLPDSIRESRNKENNAYLEQQLQEKGIAYIPVSGAYKGIDQGSSFLILADEPTAMQLGKQHLQESILTNEGLIYTSRPGATTPTTGQNLFGPEAQKEDFYSTASSLPFSLGLDFSIGPGQQYYKAGYVEAPNRPQLPMRESDGMVELHHWSNKQLKTVDPHYSGSGPLLGAERKRGAKLSFFGIAPRNDLRAPGTGYVKEAGLGPVEHVALVNPNDLYPVFEDPDGLLKDVGANWSKAEDIIRDAGYKGYYVTDDGQGRAPLGNVATLFDPIEVSEVKQSDDREAPALSDFIRNGPSQLRRALSRRVPSKQEVVGQFPAVKALFEIGKKGSPYENGITNIEDALTLAKALGITVHMFDDHQKMLEAAGAGSKTLRGRFRKTSNGASGHVFALEPGTDYRGRNLTDIEALTTLVHEMFHGVTMGPMSGVGPMLNGNGNGTPSVENAIGAMIDKPQGKRTPQERKIMREITRLQNSLSAYVEGKPTERRPVRGLMAAMDNFDQKRNQMTPEEQMDFEDKLDAHVKYIRSKAEFSVDPFWVYAVNPKMAKLVMPETTKWIRGELRKAGNKDIQFFTHPLAISIAVVMALMASEQAEDEQEEQQRQQMQPGALSPTAGMLSAA